MGELFLILLLGIAFIYFVYSNFRQNINPRLRTAEFLLIVLFSISVLLFCFAYSTSNTDYYIAIDGFDQTYTPFASKHLLTLLVFFGLSICSVLTLWLKGKKLPPLLFVLSLIFLIIGILINIVIFIQLTANNDVGMLMYPLPLSYLLISVLLLLKVIKYEAENSHQRTYKNKFLSYLNRRLTNIIVKPVYVLILLIPIFVLIVAILVLFGQNYNSVVKVFTETSTWTLSQKTHPPFLDHKGHYLCTIAVCGTPEVVKPLRLGKRHGHEIVVNRQLLIANAFEELIQENTPRLHKIIRNIYDKYGYPLSQKITLPENSNLVYRLMKPLEYIFLLALYLCCNKPEEKINKQYCI